MIPLSHGSPHFGLLPYCKLRETPKSNGRRVSFHGFPTEGWRCLLLFKPRDEKDQEPYLVLEGKDKNLNEKMRMGIRYREDTGEPFLLGHFAHGFMVALRQEKGQWGDVVLYHCLLLPWQWRINNDRYLPDSEEPAETVREGEEVGRVGEPPTLLLRSV